MKILGLISGTSHDAIDVALTEFRTDSGGNLEAQVLASDSVEYPRELRNQILRALPPQSCSVEQLTKLDSAIGKEFAAAGSAVLSAAGQASCDLVVSHGQTVFHWVEGNHACGTLQLGQPAWIAERIGAPVLADVRIRDISAGGHGAPLVSTLDRLLLRRADGKTAAALNLGGISNLTVVREDGTRAWDIGPANALMDAAVTHFEFTPEGFDPGGRLASQGRVNSALFESLLADEYYSLEPPKSTGKEHFHLQYLLDHMERTNFTGPASELLCTLTELTARTVADAVSAHGVDELFISGGGANNTYLILRIGELLPTVNVQDTESLGVGVDEKEAVLMSLIGWYSAHNLPFTADGATGSNHPRVLGALVAGSEGWPRFSSATEEPQRITFQAESL
jgi:anhydro-N-acetylmuramic acid kinase